MEPAGRGRDRGVGGWLWLTGVAALCASVPAALALSSALEIQVIAAAAGATMATGGFAVGRAAWPGWRRSELRRLVLAVGFFMCCAGLILMLAGIGVYH